ncbi:lanthionine synthetase C family protein [Myceligenerans pegani]|uniref:Lanthionine synthetase C family protein n=1 Tax=Myceligenerans pegani TaxID=2776917 RepID=A0ABR9N1D6_9MICO|nr:lanthionine synthetase C family protein [Myceligenerans sp. TRM 65318]MBE1877475.1 lanthionine synthetase C family protein [Myceligenerans sp. TRM 65318]MBE3019746.1 lanthionine synthetase C family protein [Myceligenerans sp. TRM 65318]
MTALHALGNGLAGTLLRQAVDARHTGRWEHADATLRAMTRQPIAAHPDQVGLYHGAPAVAYALRAASRPAYQGLSDCLDDAVARITTQRLTAAERRLDAGRPPRMSEYDLISGLTGLTALLLYTGTSTDLLHRGLTYLTRLLTEPVAVDGTPVPGWWTTDSPRGIPDPAQPTGHGNFGLAHGVTGPVALLALAALAGHTVPGQLDALRHTIMLLTDWARPLSDGAGYAWPEHVTLDQWAAGPPPTARRTRPSWCYGSPGITRALQITAQATQDENLQRQAETILTGCLTDPAQLDQLTDTSACHGWAGLILTASHAAADALPGSTLPDLLPDLQERFDTTVRNAPTSRARGLLTGEDGVILTRRIVPSTHLTDPAGWQTCLLLNA